MNPIEIRFKSTDPVRPNEELLNQIIDHQSELADFLREDEPSVEQTQVEPVAGFPTGLEVIAIVVAVNFATGFAKGFGKGAGEEVGKAVGEEVGKRIGARIRLWIRTRFPDVVVEDEPKGPLEG